MPRDVAIVSYCRTGIARAVRGALNHTHGIAMLGHVLENAVQRAKIDKGEVEDIVAGCGLPEGATGHNIARTAALFSGFPNTVPGITVHRYCGSGVNAASIAANRIAMGEADIQIAAGVESISMTQSHLNLNDFIYGPLQQRMPSVWWSMNQTADYVARKYGISRDEQDAYALRSQQRVAAAAARGVYAEEIVPFKAQKKVVDKVSNESTLVDVVLDRDEGPRPDSTLEGLARLKPVARDGFITAGNASQLSDGAAALVLMNADLAVKRGLPMLGLFRGMQVSAVAPEEMSIAIAPAVRRLLSRHDVKHDDVDLWELHEAYAVTTLYNQRALDTPWDLTNVNGGAIPLGHPYGMSGIRYVGSTLMELGRRKGKRAVIGVCTAGGMSTAALLESV